MNHSPIFPVSAIRVPILCMMMAVGYTTVAAQQPPSSSTDSLAQSVEELRQQVQELRAAVTEMKSEASQYRAESEQLRQELEKLHATAPPSVGANQPSTEAASTETRLANVEESTQLLASEVNTQYQTKVESASKYRVRLSGLVLFNLFRNNGFVDNQDFPTYAAPASNYGERETFGATVRQSELGLEVFGPTLAGAKTSGQLQIDFAGGFPVGALNGINAGLVRMRTASMRMDWDDTSIIAGQDNLFISPNSPTSFASLAVPSFGYSGNLWAWTPQLRVEHRFRLSGNQALGIQAGILDNVTGEPATISTVSGRLPSAGESSGQPAYATRTSWTTTVSGKPLTLGASGYLSRQHHGPFWDATGWAAAADWRIPLYSRFELSGEVFRGLAIGGIGGGIGQTVLFSADPNSIANYRGRLAFRPLNSAGGWSQLKFIATPRLEFNGVFGLDNPFSADIHAVSQPLSYYPQLLLANRSEMANFIYRPRADLLFSGEYRHLHTSQIGAVNAADQVNLVMGVLF